MKPLPAHSGVLNGVGSGLPGQPQGRGLQVAWMARACGPSAQGRSGTLETVAMAVIMASGTSIARGAPQLSVTLCEDLGQRQSRGL